MTPDEIMAHGLGVRLNPTVKVEIDFSQWKGDPDNGYARADSEQVIRIQQSELLRLRQQLGGARVAADEQQDRADASEIRERRLRAAVCILGALLGVAVTILWVTR